MNFAPRQFTPASPGCTLMQLRKDSCRWPIGKPGDSSFRFCGCPVKPGFPYCGAHAPLAYTARGWAIKCDTVRRGTPSLNGYVAKPWSGTTHSYGHDRIPLPTPRPKQVLQRDLIGRRDVALMSVDELDAELSAIAAAVGTKRFTHEFLSARVDAIDAELKRRGREGA